MNNLTRKPVVIVGPTASGKSSVAMAAAQAETTTTSQVHIVAVDAMQVYRDMNIGTAKPTKQDQALVPHHCIDLVDSHERFTVAEFKKSATDALVTIDKLNGRALLVAGTGLYLTAVIDELVLPGEFLDIRATLEEEPDTSQLFARLAELDSVAAEKMERSNRRRIVRALEVCIGTGRPFSSFGPGTSAYPDNGITQIGLRWSRDRLAQRVADRVHTMIDDGLVDEVTALRNSKQGLSRTAAQALGYKELLLHLDGKTSLDQAIADTITHTRQFAVRQERWFRRDPRIKWVSISEDPVAEIVPIIAKHLR
ncbi:MAG: tRNA (adenosine(37)-N6)-dimethylallyltransferase MiaA [Actinomycetota bacterium]|nr:tRNA (adenosine(37)-N6)-dimethylallyltransferase MiaA [Actinomycetota bacterium]MDA3004736.1 tRNA (adenosine(37)-N6)-dimethylallyltransferase MiaA [Actinomycetota bacterium]